MIKAVVLDMDGTLLNSHNEISPLTKKILHQLTHEGVHIILASGRNYKRLMPYVKELHLLDSNGHLIESNGIAIYDLKVNKRKILKQWTQKELHEIFPFLMSLECESIASSDDVLFDYFPDSIRKTKEQIRTEKHLAEDYPLIGGPWGWISDLKRPYPIIETIVSTDQIELPINKLQVIQTEDKIEEIYYILKKKYFKKYEIFRTDPKQLEILPSGISKGMALLQLMKLHNWSSEDVIAFGNGENDISLFEIVESSYAMGQSCDYVKEKAAYITKTNDEEGVYHALLHHMINRSLK